MKYEAFGPCRNAYKCFFSLLFLRMSAAKLVKNSRWVEEIPSGSKSSSKIHGRLGLRSKRIPPSPCVVWHTNHHTPLCVWEGGWRNSLREILGQWCHGTSILMEESMHENFSSQEALGKHVYTVCMILMSKYWVRGIRWAFFQALKTNEI